MPSFQQKCGSEHKDVTDGLERHDILPFEWARRYAGGLQLILRKVLDCGDRDAARYIPPIPDPSWPMRT